MDLDKLERELEEALALVKNRQPGIWTWGCALTERLLAITKLCKDAKIIIKYCGWLLKDTNPDDTSYNLEPCPWPEDETSYRNARRALLAIVQRDEPPAPPAVTLEDRVAQLEQRVTAVESWAKSFGKNGK